MKRAVMTALAVTLLSGTSVLAQEGPLARVVRERAQSQPERASPPQQQRESPRQEAAPSQPRVDRGGNDGGRGRGDGGGRQNLGQSPLAGAVQQVQRPQNGWQGQRRPDSQATTPAQGRPGGRPDAGQGRPDRQQGQRGDDGRQWQGRPDAERPGGQRPDTQYDRDRRSDEGPLARAVREARRDNDGRRPGWDNDRDWQGPRPVIRPDDRRDRDRNRPRYDQRRFPRYVTSHQRYRWRGPVWRPPVGYYSFRWQWGQTLPWNWYTPNYYLNDYWAYGLPMPPVGCEWVRVGDDAILVDVFTGRVYQVVYNLFW